MPLYFGTRPKFFNLQLHTTISLSTYHSEMPSRKEAFDDLRGYWPTIAVPVADIQGLTSSPISSRWISVRLREVIRWFRDLRRLRSAVLVSEGCGCLSFPCKSCYPPPSFLLSRSPWFYYRRDQHELERLHGLCEVQRKPSQRKIWIQSTRQLLFFLSLPLFLKNYI